MRSCFHQDCCPSPRALILEAGNLAISVCADLSVAPESVTGAHLPRHDGSFGRNGYLSRMGSLAARPNEQAPRSVHHQLRVDGDHGGHTIGGRGIPGNGKPLLTLQV